MSAETNAMAQRVLDYAHGILSGRDPSASTDIVKAPPLDDTVFGLLPRLFSLPVRATSAATRRGGLLVSVLVAVSSLLGMVRFTHRGRPYAPHLMLVVTGPPASGKGITEVARSVVMPVHKFLQGITALFGAEKEGNERHKVLLLPANSSARAFFDLWSGSGGIGFMSETEIDVLLATLKQDWARHVSAWIRQAFQHEMVQFARVETFNFIDFPMLAVLMAGTPGQLFNLFPSASDGTYSRFLFLFMPQEDEWLPGRPSEEVDAANEALQRLTRECEAIFRLLDDREEPLEVTFSKGQWDAVDAVFETLQRNALDAPGGQLGSFVPSIRRASLSALRIASTLSVLRAHDEGIDISAATKLACTDADMEASLLIAVRLLDHGLRIFLELPQREALVSSDAIDWFILTQLPHEFTRAEAVQACKSEFGVSDATVDKRLRNLVKAKKLRRVPGKNGLYERVTYGQNRVDY